MKLKDELGFFVTIPESLVERAAEIGTDALCLWVYLRYRTNRKRGSAWPGYGRIRRDLGWGNTRIAQAIQSLEPDYLTRRKRFGATTVYVLKGGQPPDMGGADASSPEMGEMDETAVESLSSPVAGGQFSRSGRPVLPERERIQDLKLTKT